MCTKLVPERRLEEKSWFAAGASLRSDSRLTMSKHIQPYSRGKVFVSSRPIQAIDERLMSTSQLLRSPWRPRDFILKAQAGLFAVDDG